MAYFGNIFQSKEIKIDYNDDLVVQTLSDLEMQTESCITEPPGGWATNMRGFYDHSDVK